MERVPRSSTIAGRILIDAKRMGVTAEDLEAAAILFRKNAVATAAATAVPNVLEKSEIIGFLSFAQSRDFLKDHGIDLEKERDDEVRAALRWGLIDEKSTDDYGANFDAIQIPKIDLEQLAQQLTTQPDLKQRVILGIDNITPAECFYKLIVRAGIGNYEWRGFPGYRKNPKTGEPLRNQAPSGTPYIIFTPDIPNLPAHLKKISPDDQLKKMAAGQKYIGPVGWMKLFRQCIDRALHLLYGDELETMLSRNGYSKLVLRALSNPKIDKYLIDTLASRTQFADLRYGDGAAPSLRFDTMHGLRRICLECCQPADAYDDLGGRPALGSFVS